MDIVYPYKRCADEIYYSLRSLKNIPHDKVFIVGDKPTGINFKTVNYIPFAQNKTKYKNTTEILKMMCQNKDLSEDFILMNDDFFILKEIKNPAEELNLYRDYALKVYEYYVKKYGNNGYSKGIIETIKLMQDKLFIANPLSYELHTPFILNKFKFLDMFNIEGVDNIACLHKRTLYGNLYLTNSKPIKDVKLFNFNSTFINPEQKLLSCSDMAWVNLKVVIQKIFNKKSIYEV